MIKVIKNSSKSTGIAYKLMVIFHLLAFQLRPTYFEFVIQLLIFIGRRNTIESNLELEIQ